MITDDRKINCVTNENAINKRIDAWLAEKFTYHSRHQWQNLLKNGSVVLNDKKCRPSKKLQQGDVITYFQQYEEPKVNTNFDIIYEDESLLAVNKPPNLPCHPAGPYFKNTLWNLLKNDNYKIHFINRIDRETSGIILIAKNSNAAAFCSKNITSKIYTTAVFGIFPKQVTAEGFIFENNNISSNDSSKVRKKRFFSYSQPPDTQSEYAKTLFCKIHEKNNISIIKAELITGRTHQIRATLCSLGFPVVGDKIYGLDESIFLRFINDSMTLEDEKSLILSRQALHSTSISFRHPISKKIISLKVNIPDDILSLYN